MPPALILSQDQTLKLKALSPSSRPSRGRPSERNSVTREPLYGSSDSTKPHRDQPPTGVDDGLAGPVRQVWTASAAGYPAASAGPLILDGLCLHVLSSFQRTGDSPGILPKPVAPSGSHRLKGNLSTV